MTARTRIQENNNIIKMFQKMRAGEHNLKKQDKAISNIYESVLKLKLKTYEIMSNPRQNLINAQKCLKIQYQNGTAKMSESWDYGKKIIDNKIMEKAKPVTYVGKSAWST